MNLSFEYHNAPLDLPLSLKRGHRFQPPPPPSNTHVLTPVFHLPLYVIQRLVCVHHFIRVDDPLWGRMYTEFPEIFDILVFRPVLRGVL